MICVDNNFLVLYFDLPAKVPNDPNTGAPPTRLPERLELLKETWKGANEKILLPDPVLAEFLIFTGADAPKYLTEFKNAANFEIRPFDTRAAVELAAMYWAERNTLSQSALKEFEKVDTKTRLKVDRQIIAIAKAHGVTAVYSDDKGIKAFADLHGIPVVRMWELPLPVSKEGPLLKLLEDQLTDGAMPASSLIAVAAADPEPPFSEPLPLSEPVPESD